MEKWKKELITTTDQYRCYKELEIEDPNIWERTYTLKKYLLTKGLLTYLKLRIKMQQKDINEIVCYTCCAYNYQPWMYTIPVNDNYIDTLFGNRW